MTPTPPADLRAALAGVRALLLDLDGVIVLKGELLPGAGEALARLEERPDPVPDRDQHVADQPGQPVALERAARRRRSRRSGS